MTRPSDSISLRASTCRFACAWAPRRTGGPRLQKYSESTEASSLPPLIRENGHPSPKALHGKTEVLGQIAPTDHMKHKGLKVRVGPPTRTSAILKASASLHTCHVGSSIPQV